MKLSDSESDDNNPLGGRVHGRKKKLCPLEMDVDGLPILPNSGAKGKALSVADMKSILRSFFTHSYRMCPIMFMKYC